MMKHLALLAFIAVALTGCTLKMGNTSVGLFEGWNQPTATTQRTEVMVLPPTVNSSTTVTPAK